MSSLPTNLVASPQTPVSAPLIEGKADRISWAWLKWAQGITQAVNQALNILGIFNGILGLNATVEGHPGTLADTVQHLTATGTLDAAHLTGVVPSAQLPPALPSVQGAVVLPSGAPSNTLGSAAFADTSAFDPAGAAATAQTNAESFATAGDVATLAGAQAYTNGKFAGAITVTITTAALTGTGTQGSMTFTNGLLTAQTPAT